METLEKCVWKEVVKREVQKGIKPNDEAKECLKCRGYDDKCRNYWEKYRSN